MSLTMAEPEECALLRAAVRQIVDREAPMADVRRWDDEEHYPAHLYDVLAEAGFFAMPFREEFGGSEAGAREMVTVAEELGRRGMDIAAGFTVSVFLGLSIQNHGSEEQQRRMIPGIVRNEKRVSISMTEPDAGSDASAIASTAIPAEGGWMLNGQKVFTTGAGLPNTTLMVTARVKAAVDADRDFSIFLVPATADGVVLRRLSTVGRHILGTYEVFLNDVFVPQTDLVSAPGRGWAALRSSLTLERLTSCGAYLGGLATVVDLATEYARTRRQFGQPIAEYQAISHPIVDSAVDLQAARLLVYSAADKIAAGLDARADVSAAKLFVTEAYNRATGHAMQVFGGYGYVTEYDVHRFWKDARIGSVTAGTSQIQRGILCRDLGLQ